MLVAGATSGRAALAFGCASVKFVLFIPALLYSVVGAGVAAKTAR
jgi:hypothetical protein